MSELSAGSLDAEWSRLALEREGAVLRVWLDRPARRNALDTAALEEITALFDGLQSEFGVRVAVLGGRGPAFCAGADRKDPPGAAAMAGGAGERERRFAAQIGRRACNAIQDCEVVTIVRVHGYAVGGGLALALACDFRLAAEDAFFQVPEVDLGIPLSWGATPRLVHELGAARARELILMAERVEARRAEAWGLVHRTLPPDDLERAVADWAERLASKPEAAVHRTKTQLRGLAQRARLGDVTEADGELLAGASRLATARRSFGEGREG